MKELVVTVGCLAVVIVSAHAALGHEDLRVLRGSENDSMNALAERYVKLVLALGQHDADYVDAYYGPQEWRTEAATAKRTLADIDRDAATALTALATAKPA